METSEASAGLSFDKASYSEKTEQGLPCANCNGPLGEQYWHWQARAVCEKCRGKIADLLTASQSKQAFVRAALLGGATALGCGIAYAIFVAVTGYQLAIVTIGIAFLIAKVIRHCSAGIGGRKFQILAVALTYLASAMGYAPAIVSAMKDGGVAFILALTMAAPFLAATTAPIGLLIVGFALWEAWKMSRGLPVSLDGPYRAAPATGPPAV